MERFRGRSPAAASDGSLGRRREAGFGPLSQEVQQGDLSDSDQDSEDTTKDATRIREIALEMMIGGIARNRHVYRYVDYESASTTALSCEVDAAFPLTS